MQTAIPFPDISPVLVEIPLGFTTLPIRWYALAYIVGIWLGYLLARHAIRRARLWKHDTPPLTPEQLEEFLTWLILGIILGGRIGYVLGYGRGQFLEDPMAIFRVWEGGMAFHGGFLGVTIAGLIFWLKHRMPMASFADLLALGTPPGLLLGRIANFINAELWGRPTDKPWGVIFPGNAAQDCPGVEGLCARHPSQLYEAGLEGILLGALLIAMVYLGGWLKRPGVVCGTFIAGYGVSRFVVEFFRQADAQFITPDNPLGHVMRIGEFGITRGQQFSLPMILVGITILVLALRRR
ncbi:MAG: prolipoprotein diacylglyceryl transferase [Silicimonas sp.]|jgi:phosphatidylglycerol:prolipoprotein diacylglycerol transferase|nr:prolipoprotein diacylglyceryl transferase [Silicimonas sp.]